MKITATEQHRLGTSVNVVFQIDDQEPYNRYVNAINWDDDPDAIIASVYEYLTNVPAGPQITAALKTDSIDMTTQQVNDKLVEIELTKLALIEPNEKEPK